MTFLSYYYPDSSFTVDNVVRYCNKDSVPLLYEVKRDGVDQGELNRVLMQKVEELTLYITDLQKQIEELKNK